MSIPRHHPSDDLILDFARGALNPGRVLVMDAHIRACPDCAKTARLAEAVGGALLAELTPAEMAPDALEKALAAIGRPVAAPKPAPRQPDDWIRVPPEVLEAYAARKRWAAPGVWVANISRDRRTGARTYLLGVGANIAVPNHSHRGKEMTTVLKGAFRVGEAVYAVGDFEEADEAIEHQPKTTPDGECVCLISVDHNLVPRSLMAWVLQPIVGI